jgi:hypothetical protein
VKKSVDTYAQGILRSSDQLCFSRQICERNRWQPLFVHAS